jgi:hypothetical protein
MIDIRDTKSFPTTFVWCALFDPWVCLLHSCIHTFIRIHIIRKKKKIFKELKGVYLQKISKHEKTGKFFFHLIYLMRYSHVRSKCLKFQSLQIKPSSSFEIKTRICTNIFMHHLHQQVFCSGLPSSGPTLRSSFILETHLAGITPEPIRPDWWIILSKRAVNSEEDFARLSTVNGFIPG